MSEKAPKGGLAEQMQSTGFSETETGQFIDAIRGSKRRNKQPGNPGGEPSDDEQEADDDNKEMNERADDARMPGKTKKQRQDSSAAAKKKAREVADKSEKVADKAEKNGDTESAGKLRKDAKDIRDKADEFEKSAQDGDKDQMKQASDDLKDSTETAIGDMANADQSNKEQSKTKGELDDAAETAASREVPTDESKRSSERAEGAAEKVAKDAEGAADDARKGGREKEAGELEKDAKEVRNAAADLKKKAETAASPEGTSEDIQAAKEAAEDLKKKAEKAIRDTAQQRGDTPPDDIQTEPEEGEGDPLGHVHPPTARIKPEDLPKAEDLPPDMFDKEALERIAREIAERSEDESLGVRMRLAGKRSRVLARIVRPSAEPEFPTGADYQTILGELGGFAKKVSYARSYATFGGIFRRTPFVYVKEPRVGRGPLPGKGPGHLILVWDVSASMRSFGKDEASREAMYSLVEEARLRGDYVSLYMMGTGLDNSFTHAEVGAPFEMPDGTSFPGGYPHGRMHSWTSDTIRRTGARVDKFPYRYWREGTTGVYRRGYFKKTNNYDAVVSAIVEFDFVHLASRESPADAIPMIWRDLRAEPTEPKATMVWVVDVGSDGVGLYPAVKHYLRAMQALADIHLFHIEMVPWSDTTFDLEGNVMTLPQHMAGLMNYIHIPPSKIDELSERILKETQQVA